MNKNTLIIVLSVLVILLVVFLIGSSDFFKNMLARKSDKFQASPNPSKELIGGQKDEHGCLTAAGYSWCEAKQKCLKEWEDACPGSVDTATPSASATPTATPDPYAGWFTYTSKKYGFSIKLPPTWQGYKAGEKDWDAYSDASFSFSEGHQPFSIFSVIIFTPEQWKKTDSSAVKVLATTDSAVYVCDGCCGMNADFYGGGQFDDFQIARCKEGVDIVKTFKLTSGQ